MSTGFVMGAPTGDINPEKGVIEGVSICTVGEAEGHGVCLDQDFVRTVVSKGNEKRQGLKARYGHPNMSSTALGTFLGRFKRFRLDGNQARADLFLSNEAKDTPNGNLYDYVLGMAENEPDMFGTSIVFTPGREYKRDADGNKVYYPGWSPDEDETGAEHDERRQKWRETPGPLFIECEELHGCDAVDEPAANDGLFSAFSMDTVAGQVTQFLDLHPQVWTAIQTNPSIIEALGRYGKQMDGFIERYRAYREHHQEGGMTMLTEPTNSEELDTGAAVEGATAGEPEATETIDETTEAAAEAQAEEVDEEAAAEPSEPEEEEAETLSRSEFARIADEFGDAIAAQTMREGGDYQTALKASHDALRKENVELRTNIEKLGAVGTGKPAKVVSEPKEKAQLFKTGK